MSQITVRQATLADAGQITALHNANITTWTRRDVNGEPVPADYADLSLFERWMVGGPWASVEMCAVHLANLLRGSDGIPLVAEIDGRVGAEAEVFIGREPEPFGHHINISRLAIHPQDEGAGLSSALLAYIVQMAEAIIRDKRRILPCAAYCEKEYGIGGYFVGVPCMLGRNGVEKVIEVPLSADEKAAFQVSIDHVKELVAAAEKFM